MDLSYDKIYVKGKQIIMSIITIFSKKQRNIGDIVTVIHKEHNNSITGIVTGLLEHNPKYQNHKITASRTVNTGKDYYLVDIEDI